MRAGDLKRILEGVDDDVMIVLSADGEGNDYSPLDQASVGRYVYVPYSTWSGELALAELTEADREEGYTEEDLYEGDDAERCIVFWPVN